MRAIDIMPKPVKGKARNAYEEIFLEGYEIGYEMEKQERNKFYVLNAHAVGISIPEISAILSIPDEEVSQIIQNQG